ncbi:hypothetical protein Acr_12g0002860 [Actinidia rufa]|uniref:Uncharacterized protein n=1 Tax=Actinidia rufa TaxID=165716 RepID=A0A7J0FGF1_9ERIC|nr:hypothetical protein Acr_12g0002860 [Actinidia rufa]
MPLFSDHASTAWLVAYCQLSTSPSRHGGCQKLAKQRCLGGNDGLSSRGHSSLAVIASSSGTEGLRAYSVATVGQDLYPRLLSNGVRTELQRRVPSSSLCSGNSSGVPALARLFYSTYGLRVLSPRPFCCQGEFEATRRSGSSPSAAHMELNRAQLLVHDDRALEKFRATHGIPTNVTIEHPVPNNIPHVVAEKLNCIPICTWLIHQAGLRFLINPMLKEVMARYRLTFMQVSINFVHTVLAVDMLVDILD